VVDTWAAADRMKLVDKALLTGIAMMDLLGREPSHCKALALLVRKQLWSDSSIEQLRCHLFDVRGTQSELQQVDVSAM